MTKTRDRLPFWQLALGFWGFLLWVPSFQAAQFLEQRGWPRTADFSLGYAIGVIAGWAGYVFYKCIRGQSENFLSGHPIWRALSYIVLFIVLVTGVAATCIDIWGSTSGSYNAGFYVGGLVSGFGISAVVDHLTD